MSNNFGKYQILSVLGQGAMGKVYLAQDPQGMQIALKVILPEALERSGNANDTIERFKRESKLALELVHPHIVRTYDAGEVDGKLFLTCELMSGGSLEDILKEHKILSEKKALLVIRDVAMGLNEIHQKGFIHRDIKPANVLMDASGKAKLSDLGLLRSTSQDRTILTQPGSLIGTPHYISPEQIEGEGEIDIRCDIYALGAVLFGCLAGHTPYSGSVLAVLQSHLIDPIPAVVEQKIRPQLQQLINDMMAKNPQDRLAHPRELLEIIDILLADADNSTLTPESSQKGQKPNKSAMTFVPGENVDQAAQTSAPSGTPPKAEDASSATVSYAYPSPHKPYEPKSPISPQIGDGSAVYAYPTAMSPPPKAAGATVTNFSSPPPTAPQDKVSYATPGSIDNTVVREGAPDRAAETFAEPSAPAPASVENTIVRQGVPDVAAETFVEPSTPMNLKPAASVDNTMIRQGIPDVAAETFVEPPNPISPKSVTVEDTVVRQNIPNKPAETFTDPHVASELASAAQKFLDPNASQTPIANQIKIAPATNQLQLPGLNRAKLVVTSPNGIHTLFVYGGSRIQAGRNGIDYPGQDLCLRLRPSAGNEKSIKRISGTHFNAFIENNRAFFCDVGSRSGSVFDGQPLVANVPREITASHAVKIAGVIDVTFNMVASTQALQYNIEGVGIIDNQTPSVFMVRPFNGAEHAYALVPGLIKLSVQHGALRPNIIGSISIFYALGSLWISGGSLPPNICSKVCEGLSFQTDGHNVNVHQIFPQDQK